MLFSWFIVFSGIFVALSWVDVYYDDDHIMDGVDFLMFLVCIMAVPLAFIAFNISERILM